MRPKHRLAAASIAVMWGINFIAIHFGLEHFPPIFFAALRFAVLAVPVVLFVPRPRVKLRYFLLYGVGFGVLQFGFLFIAMNRGMPTGLASLVLQTSAPFTVLLGVILLGERLSGRQAAGLGLAILGIVVIGIERLESGLGGLVPMLLTVAAGLSWALGNVGTRLARSAEPLRLTLWMSVIPPLPLYLLSAVMEGPRAGFRAVGSAFTSAEGLRALGALAYIVVFGTVAGAGLWAWLMARYPASTVAPVSLAVPVVGMSSAWLVLGEVPGALALGGGVIVILGCALALTGPRTRLGRAETVA